MLWWTYSGGWSRDVAEYGGEVFAVCGGRGPSVFVVAGAVPELWPQARGAPPNDDVYPWRHGRENGFLGRWGRPMTELVARLPQLDSGTWILLAAIAVAAWMLREDIQEIVQDTIDGREDVVGKYGILLVGGFLGGWVWADAYPTTPSGVVSAAVGWATSLIPI